MGSFCGKSVQPAADVIPKVQESDIQTQSSQPEAPKEAKTMAENSDDAVATKYTAPPPPVDAIPALFSPGREAMVDPPALMYVGRTAPGTAALSRTETHAIGLSHGAAGDFGVVDLHLQKDYLCKNCGKSFLRKAGLDVHLMGCGAHDGGDNTEAKTNRLLPLVWVKKKLPPRCCIHLRIRDFDDLCDAPYTKGAWICREGHECNGEKTLVKGIVRHYTKPLISPSTPVVAPVIEAPIGKGG